MPAVWRRAVRLTKKRIEAATPMTMAEFRADKDQLRAEFALSTRRLEMNVEALRTPPRRAAARHQPQEDSELGGIKAERDSHLHDRPRTRGARSRTAPPRPRTRKGRRRPGAAACACATANYADKVSQLDSRPRSAARQAAHAPSISTARRCRATTTTISTSCSASSTIERKRAEFLEDQNRTLIGQLESSDKRTAEANAAAAELREALAAKDDAGDRRRDDLVAAEARIADAENRLNAVLAETSQRGRRRRTASASNCWPKSSTLEDELEKLRSQGADGREHRHGRLGQRPHRAVAPARTPQRHRLRRQPPGLRRRGRRARPTSEESLFDRVQRFADDGMTVEELPVHAAPQGKPGRSARRRSADRLAALRESAGHAELGGYSLLADHRNLADHLAAILPSKMRTLVIAPSLVGRRELPVGRDRRDDLGAGRDLQRGDHVVGAPARGAAAAVAHDAVDKGAADRDKAQIRSPIENRNERRARPMMARASGVSSSGSPGSVC